MTASVLVKARTVLKKYVEEVLGGDQLLEEEPNRLLDRQRLTAVWREDDPVFGLDPVDSLLHWLSLRHCICGSTVHPQRSDDDVPTRTMKLVDSCAYSTPPV